MRGDVHHLNITHISKSLENLVIRCQIRKDSKYLSLDGSWSQIFFRFYTVRADVQGWSEYWGQKGRCGWV